MSAKTKIIVLKMKSLIFTTVMIGLGIILLILILTVVIPQNSKEGRKSVDTASYVPGVYTSSVQLNDTAIDVMVTVDENNINNIELVNLDEKVETMYPLIGPAMEDLSNQIIENQSTEDITYPTTSQYTSIVLMNAVEDALKKART
ncbi:MAG: hypothetical protein UH211_04200 [Agathobacter sp.]|nr:hypothetical protein [Agathobacter sp.]